VSVSVNQSGAREDVWRVPYPVVMAVPPPAMPGVWQVGGVVHGSCCAPVTLRARLFRVDRIGGGGPRRHARGDAA